MRKRERLTQTLNIRIKESTKNKLIAEAESENMTLSELINDLLDEYVNR